MILETITALEKAVHNYAKINNGLKAENKILIVKYTTLKSEYASNDIDCERKAVQYNSRLTLSA